MLYPDEAGAVLVVLPCLLFGLSNDRTESRKHHDVVAVAPGIDSRMFESLICRLCITERIREASGKNCIRIPARKLQAALGGARLKDHGLSLNGSLDI